MIRLQPQALCLIHASGNRKTIRVPPQVNVTVLAYMPDCSKRPSSSVMLLQSAFNNRLPDQVLVQQAALATSDAAATRQESKLSDCAGCRPGRRPNSR